MKLLFLYYLKPKYNTKYHHIRTPLIPIHHLLRVCVRVCKFWTNLLCVGDDGWFSCYTIGPDLWQQQRPRIVTVIRTRVQIWVSFHWWISVMKESNYRILWSDKLKRSWDLVKLVKLLWTMHMALLVLAFGWR